MIRPFDRPEFRLDLLGLAACVIAFEADRIRRRIVAERRRHRSELSNVLAGAGAHLCEQAEEVDALRLELFEAQLTLQRTIAYHVGEAPPLPSVEGARELEERRREARGPVSGEQIRREAVSPGDFRENPPLAGRETGKDGTPRPKRRADRPPPQN